MAATWVELTEAEKAQLELLIEASFGMGNDVCGRYRHSWERCGRITPQKHTLFINSKGKL